MAIVKLLRNQEFLLVSAVVLGLLWPGPASPLLPTVLPTLGLVIFLSTLAVPNRNFTQPAQLLRSGLEGVLFSFVLLGGVIIGLSYLLLDDAYFRTGYVFAAAAPPATGVIAFTYSFKGDATHALLAVLGGYLASLVLTPLMIMLFLDSRVSLDPVTLLMHVALLVLAPLLASRAALALGWQHFLDPIKGDVIKWLFFLVFYVLVGVNRSVLLTEFDLLGRIALVAVLFYFGLGGLVYLISRRLEGGLERTVARTLLVTCKNLGLAGGMVLSLAGARAAVPCTVAVLFMLAFLTIAGALLRRPGGAAA